MGFEPTILRVLSSRLTNSTKADPVISSSGLPLMWAPDPTLAIFEQGNCLRVQFSMVDTKGCSLLIIYAHPFKRSTVYMYLGSNSIIDTEGTRYLRAEHRLINRDYVTAGGDIMYLSTTGDTLLEGRPINIARLIFREIVNRAVPSIRDSH